MDVSDASYYIHENNEKIGSQMGHTKKIFKKIVSLQYIVFVSAKSQAAANIKP